eukprot:GFKZ01015161.1.p1 GENE.GFKZ01015161.1~~GFKZ01015161.1.p1  ORF type:complete len:721 (-),score=65.74 GFKZ01015161.1:1831-3993(-)
MGIVGFQRWLLQNFPGCARVQGNRVGQPYDHVAFDMNQIIHKAARRADTRASLASAIFHQLDQILKSCVPRKSIFLAYDGPGPFAKLKTQRKRRCKSKSGNCTNNAPLSSNRPRAGKTPVDSLEFTPGVEMVLFLLEISEYWAYTRLQNDRKYRNVDICISGCDVAGEGELKLMDYFRSEHVSPTDSVVVVGGDADIVLQGLATTRIRNFFVYLHQMPSPRKKSTNYVISVWELCRTFEQMFPGESDGVRIDFILLCILNGNDYIPKIRGSSLSRLWSRYRRLKAVSRKGNRAPFHGECIIDAQNRTINWPMFGALVERGGESVPSIEDELRVAHGGVSRRGTSSNAGNDSRVAAHATSRIETHVSDKNSDPGDVILYNGDENGIWMRESDDFDTLSHALVESVGNRSKKVSLGGVTRYNSGGEVQMQRSDKSNGNASSHDLYIEETGCDLDEQEEEEEFDEEGQHIATLVALYGSDKKLYDTERWFQTALWTIHMYIDGFCSDYLFDYGKPYGPSCDILAQYIKDHGTTQPTIHAPISQAPPLLPHQAAMAMLPKRAAHLLPRPLQQIVQDPVLSEKIFPPRQGVDIHALVAEVNRIPKSAYSHDELPCTMAGHPLLLRLPRAGDYRRPTYNPRIKKPGPSFHEISYGPVIYRSTFTMTTSPPCYPWPCGSEAGLMSLPYMKVTGQPLVGRGTKTGRKRTRAQNTSTAQQSRVNRHARA